MTLDDLHNVDILKKVFKSILQKDDFEIRR